MIKINPLHKDIIAKIIKLDIPKNIVYLCYRGSIAHNTYIPNTDPNSVDDIDLLGVFLANKEYYIGLDQRIPVTVEVMHEVDGVLLDCVFYEIRHFINMALKNNPNISTALWVHDKHKIFVHPYFQPYISNRSEFLSKRNVYKTFTGYANDQLKKLSISKHYGYMGEKRTNIVKKFGYDVKHASHLIRLLRMGIEALQTGRIKVFRDTDADMLMDIKLGKWTLNEVKTYAEELFGSVKTVYKNSTLPEKPNKNKIERLLMRFITAYINDGTMEKGDLISFFI